MGFAAWDGGSADVAQALAELRQAVYDSGDFYQEEADPSLALTEEQFVAQLDPAHDAMGLNEALLDEWRAAQQRPRPVDPDTLFAAQPHSGTHSVIDMVDGVSTDGQPDQILFAGYSGD